MRVERVLVESSRSIFLINWEECHMTDNDDINDVPADETAIEADETAMLRKREIVAHVSQDTGQSKADVRLILDSALGYMRQGLLDGNELHYPTLGKIRIKHPNREGAKPMYRLVPAKDARIAAMQESDDD